MIGLTDVRRDAPVIPVIHQRIKGVAEPDIEGERRRGRDAEGGLSAEAKFKRRQEGHVRKRRDFGADGQVVLHGGRGLDGLAFR